MTASELRTRAETADTIVGPVLRDDGTTGLLKLDRTEVIEALGLYEDDERAPWQIDEPSCEDGCLTLKAERPAAEAGATEVTFAGARYRCVSASNGTIVFTQCAAE